MLKRRQSLRNYLKVYLIGSKHRLDVTGIHDDFLLFILNEVCCFCETAGQIPNFPGTGTLINVILCHLILSS